MGAIRRNIASALRWQRHIHLTMIQVSLFSSIFREENFGTASSNTIFFNFWVFLQENAKLKIIQEKSLPYRLLSVQN